MFLLTQKKVRSLLRPAEHERGVVSHGDNSLWPALRLIAFSNRDSPVLYSWLLWQTIIYTCATNHTQAHTPHETWNMKPHGKCHRYLSKKGRKLTFLKTYLRYFPSCKSMKVCLRILLKIIHFSSKYPTFSFRITIMFGLLMRHTRNDCFWIPSNSRSSIFTLPIDRQIKNGDFDVFLKIIHIFTCLDFDRYAFFLLLVRVCKIYFLKKIIFFTFVCTIWSLFILPELKKKTEVVV